MAAAPAALQGRTHSMPTRNCFTLNYREIQGLMCTDNDNLPAGG